MDAGRKETKNTQKQHDVGWWGRRGKERDYLPEKESEEQTRREENGKNIFRPHVPPGTQRVKR